MPFYARIVTAGGTTAIDATPAPSIKAAMATACAALRYGATDAWVDDENGKRVATFDDIKKHCGISN